MILPYLTFDNSPPECKPYLNLSTTNSAFVEDTTFADVRFLLKDGKQALVHKAFFAARIPSIVDQIKAQDVSDVFNKITYYLFISVAS